MARVLALTLFFIVGLGGPALCLLVKTEHKNVRPEVFARLAEFLTAHVLWLFAIPILYAVIAAALRDRVSKKAIEATGIAVCAVSAAVLGSLIVLYLL